MSADSPKRASGSRNNAVPAVVPPQVVSDHSIIDSAIGFINDVTLSNQTITDPKDTIIWARFESAADISDPCYGEDWELEGNVAPPLLLILGYGMGVQVWAIPANGEAVEVLSWRHGIVSVLRILPTPTISAALQENGRADEPIDAFADRRPLIALVDGGSTVNAQPQFCAVNFISLKTGTQVKTIKFKNPILDILCNRTSIVITFLERIAIFDSRTLEDRLLITTCFPSPGINPNPVTLGTRWLAYAEYKLLSSRRSGGGCDGEAVASYTATMLNAAKSLGKGLRELGGQVAAGLTGNTSAGSLSKNNSFDSMTGADAKQPGIVTILDIKKTVKDYSPSTGVPVNGLAGSDPIVAHFMAHSEAIVAMEFDNSGMLLLTADKRGHDFHIFRVQPHPVGSSLAAVHHLYVLHRGDTSSKVQDITFSLDSRWVAISTLRGTTHVFPITPYGGPMGVRTHTSLHVVNKLSRFHRSAGLSADGRSNSPISHSDSTTFVQSLQPYNNATLAPFPRPHVVLPLAQLRQPSALGSPPSSASMSAGVKVPGTAGAGSQRQRLSSLSDDNGKPLSVCAIFAKSRSWLLDPPNTTREPPHRLQRKSVDSLFVMAGHGALIQYDLDTKLASNVAKEKICDDTPIELEVEAKAQWNLGRRKEGSQEMMPPLSSDNWLLKDRYSCYLTDSTRQYDDIDERAESWLSQVEIITHAGPHRRLWMGPQFVFKTYNTPSGSNLNHIDVEAVEIGVTKATMAAGRAGTGRSSPLNMPLSTAGRSSVPVLIESSSYSSIEQSPKLMDRFPHGHIDSSDLATTHGDTRLKEDLADAMRESPSISANAKDTDGRLLSIGTASSENIPFYDALDEQDHEQDDDPQFDYLYRSSSAMALASVLPNISSYDQSPNFENFAASNNNKKQKQKPSNKASIEKIVNPLGTVTTVTPRMTGEIKTDTLDEVVSQLAAEESIIHENCDEALFRPIAIYCEKGFEPGEVQDTSLQQELCKPPESIGNKLIVPFIAKEVDAEMHKKDKEKYAAKSRAQTAAQQQQAANQKQQKMFAELSQSNKKITKYEPMSEVALETVSKNIAKLDIGNQKLNKYEPMSEVALKTVSKSVEKVDMGNQKLNKYEPMTVEALETVSKNMIKVDMSNQKLNKYEPMTVVALDGLNKNILKLDLDSKMTTTNPFSLQQQPEATKQTEVQNNDVPPESGDAKTDANIGKTINKNPTSNKNKKKQKAERSSSGSEADETIDVSNIFKQINKKVEEKKTCEQIASKQIETPFFKDLKSCLPQKIPNSVNRKKEDGKKATNNDVEKANTESLMQSVNLSESLTDGSMQENYFKSTKLEKQSSDKSLNEEKKKPAIPKRNLTFNAVVNTSLPSLSVKTKYDDFALISDLEMFPPLGNLEPLDVNTTTADKDFKRNSIFAAEYCNTQDDSSIAGSSSFTRDIQPPLRGFSEENLIFALCGSLHYENEHKTDNHKNDMAAVKKKTTTIAASDKFSSSANSSASEEIIILDEKRATKKQRRKKKELLQKLNQNTTATEITTSTNSNNSNNSNNNKTEDDEELRPLISMSDSIVDHFSTHSFAAVLAADEPNEDIGFPFDLTPTHKAANNSTDDSESPLPATTSDDNVNVVCTLPINTSSTTAGANTPHKMKTKKLEHKFNLIAAIEAATSSSTSSAEEESGMETQEIMGTNTLINMASSSSMSASATQAGGGINKKKTKRRKR